MQALIFAAGLGTRMLPLTRHTPKPLLAVRGKPLIVYHLQALAAAGVRTVVINISHLAQQFQPALGDGQRWGIAIHYVYEGATPLETGGGMLNALHYLDDAPFIAVNGDIHTDFDFATLPTQLQGMAHLVLTDNPPHHPDGDFHLTPEGRITLAPSPKLTFAGIGVYRPQLLARWQEADVTATYNHAGQPAFPIAPVLRQAIAGHQITGQHFRGAWTDVGTPQRLARLQHDA